MKIFLTVSKYIYVTFLLLGLAFSCSVFLVLLYSKLSGDPSSIGRSSSDSAFAASLEPVSAPDESVELPFPAPPVKKRSAMIDAPVVLQYPELPNGCELTTLAMMLQFYGINKGKMELLPEMNRDTTPFRTGPDGTIEYWGNPNTGFVGDITGKHKGFGIYHAGLFGLLQSYIPTATDMTRSSFEELERQVSDGIPVLVWTTIRYTVPSDRQWVTWDSPLGPIRTTFQEHTVLLVGYDEDYVYVNDPLKAEKKHRVEKKQFIASWEAMGKQALSYTKQDG